MASLLHRETAVDLLREDWDAVARPESFVVQQEQDQDQDRSGDPLDEVLAWLNVADLDQDDLQNTPERGTAAAPFPQRPLRRKQSNYCAGEEEELMPGVDPEEQEWNRRFQRTGAAGRLVSYQAGDRPSDDFILRGGGERRVVVSSVRRCGLAEKAGVKSGDILVSINGKKDFAGSSAVDIHRRMRAPVTLVFLGFIGKWHAEVRLNTKERLCGLQSEMPIAVGRPDAPLQVYEEIVFQPTTAPLLLAVPPESGSRPKLPLPQGDMGDVDEVDDSKDVASDATPEDVLDLARSQSTSSQSGWQSRASEPHGEPQEGEGASLITPRTIQAPVSAVYELRGKEAKRLVEQIKAETRSTLPLLTCESRPVTYEEEEASPVILRSLPPRFETFARTAQERRKKDAKDALPELCGLEASWLWGRCER